MSLSGDTALVGALFDDPDSESGSAHVFRGLIIDPMLTYTGPCPGAATVSFSGFTPFGDVVVARASAPGSLTISRGLCAGTDLGLSGPSRLKTIQVDSQGELFLNPPEVSEGLCGNFLQAVDSSSRLPH